MVTPSVLVYGDVCGWPCLGASMNYSGTLGMSVDGTLQFHLMDPRNSFRYFTLKLPLKKEQDK